MSKSVYHVTFTRYIYKEEWYVMAADTVQAVKKAITGSTREKGLWHEVRKQDMITPVHTVCYQTSLSSLDEVIIPRGRNTKVLKESE